MTDTATEYSAEQLDLIRTEAAALDVSELPKIPTLIELTRKVFGRVGDHGKTTKAEYVAKLNAADRVKVNEAIVEMVLTGDLELAWEDVVEREPEQQQQRKAPMQQQAGDDAEAARKIREALETLGIGAKAQPLDEDAVRALASDVATNLIAAQQDAITSNVGEIVAAAMKNIEAREIVVKSERGEFKVEGAQHERFETLLQLCAARQPDGHRLNVWLYGPPGTGKTTAARNAAGALGMRFYCNGALSTKYELTGFVDAHSKLVRTPFRDAWEYGGVYLFDEIDGSVPQAVVAFNAALANGVMAFPDGMVDRHPDCVIVAAANTVGLGATAEFTGRMKIDAATLDRFVMTDWPIDEKLETRVSGNAAWTKTVQAFRRAVAAKGFKGVQITPRASIYGAALLAQGMSEEVVKALVLRKGMTAEQWAALN